MGIRRGKPLRKNVLKQKIGGLTISVARAVFLIALAFILIYPIIFMIANSVKVTSDTVNPAVNWFSLSPTVYSYEVAFTAMDYMKSLFITITFELVSAFLEVVMCAVYAYGLARFKFKFKKVLMFLLILCILLPDIMLIIPRILNFRYMDFLGILGLLKNFTGVDLRPDITDTVFTFYLPSILGVGLKGGLFIYIYMQFFKGLPNELEEAAWIDGAGPIKTFIRIIIPSSTTVILTVSVFAFIWHWNDWLLATMYTTDNHTLAYMLKNVSVYINQLWSEQAIGVDRSSYYGAPLAACLMFIAPPTVIYIFVQKYFIESIDRVGIVG